MQYSKNYNMNLPELADQFNIKQWNDNTEKIDTELKTNADAISAEERRATQKENTLSSAISTETTRAKEKENSLSSSISAETSRAKTAESNIINGVTPAKAIKDQGNSIGTPGTWGIGFGGTGEGIKDAKWFCCYNSDTYSILPFSDSKLKQMNFDVMFPVGKVVQQLPGEDSPQTMYNKNGIVSTWQDITSQFDGRFFKIDTTKNVGDTTAESLPNIKGSISGSGGPNGVFTKSTGIFKLTEKTQDGSTDQRSDGTFRTASIDLSDGGTSPLYKDGAKVQPDNVSIKLWKRIK